MLLFTLPNLAVSCPIHSITLFYLARTSHRLTLCIFASWKDLKPELLQLTHLFSQGISKAPFQVPYYSGRSRHSTETVSEFHAEALQATASEGLAKGPYVAVRTHPHSFYIFS